MDESRVLRSRQTAIAGMLDRARGVRREIAAARRLVQVYDGGAMPTGPDKVYLTHPAEMGGDECEACPGTPVVDTSTTIPVVFLRNAPAVGDIVAATAVGGRWVAEEDGTQKGCNCVCLCKPVGFPNGRNGTVVLSIAPDACWSGYNPNPLFGPPCPWIPQGSGPWPLNSGSGGCLWTIRDYIGVQSSVHIVVGCGTDGNVGVLMEVTLGLTIVYSTAVTTTIPTGVDVQLILVDYTANPFHLHYRPTLPAGYHAPFTDLYVDGPGVPTGPLMCAGFCIKCFPSDPATVTVYSGSTQVATGVTGASGCVTLYWTGKPGIYTITVDAPGYPLYTKTEHIGCNGGDVFDVIPGQAACCVGPCPVGNTIYVSDFYGTYAATYQPPPLGDTRCYWATATQIAPQPGIYYASNAPPFGAIKVESGTGIPYYYQIFDASTPTQSAFQVVRVFPVLSNLQLFGAAYEWAVGTAVSGPTGLPWTLPGDLLTPPANLASGGVCPNLFAGTYPSPWIANSAATVNLTSCFPLAWSGALAVQQPPVPFGPGCGITDPVPGGVAISA